MEFFRHCPGCGQRFHIVLVDKEQVGAYDTPSPGPITVIRGRGVAFVGEDEPFIFDIKEFQCRYKCKHCGHEWTETRLEDRNVTELRDQGIGIDEEGELD